MTILTDGGSWAAGCVHTVVDDGPRQPSPEQIMAWFLKLSETTIISVLARETADGTLTQKQADRILTGYCKKKQTYNAYAK